MAGQLSYNGIGILFIAVIIFFALLFLISSLGSDKALQQYEDANTESAAISNFMSGSAEKTKEVIFKYKVMIFAGIAAITLFTLLVLFGIAKATGLLSKIGLPPFLSIPFFFWLLFGINMVFVEKRNTAIINGVIFFIGYPLMYSSALMVLGCIGLFMWSRKGGSLG